MSMNMKVFAIGGLIGECPVGTAHDPFTFLNLLELVELKGGYAVSLHGVYDNKTFSGEYLLKDAKNIVTQKC